jgi:hypothetical protein
MDRARLAAIMERTRAGHDGTAHDGEALAAVHAANRLLDRHGMTWGDLLLPPKAPQPFPRPSRTDEALLAALERCPLADWPRDFVQGIRARLRSGHALTPVQRAKLRELAREHGIAGGAYAA